MPQRPFRRHIGSKGQERRGRLLGRRRFDHLVTEISVRTGSRAPRYALWLRLHELGADPEQLARSQCLAFYDEFLLEYLTEHELALSKRQRRSLRRAVRRHDPTRPTPEEGLGAIEEHEEG